MKFKIFIILIVILSIFITGCTNKVEEKIAEKILEDATDGTVDISNDIATIKTGNTETRMGENLKWPKDIMGELPELKANINMIMEDYDKERDISIGIVYFDNLKSDDAENYVEAIKELKYEAVFETSSEEGFFYSGNDESGSEVYFEYNKDGSGSLSHTDNQFMFSENPYDSNSSGSSSSSEDIDMTDDIPWPSEFFNDVPEIEGKITQVSSGSPQDKFVYIEYVTKDNALDYLDKLKDNGFVDYPSESLSGSYLSYEAGNDNGDYIIFDWSDNETATINFMKGE